MLFAACHPCCPRISTSPRPGVEIALSSHHSLLQQAHTGLSIPASDTPLTEIHIRLFSSLVLLPFCLLQGLNTSNTICLIVSDIKIKVSLVGVLELQLSPHRLGTTSLLLSREAQPGPSDTVERKEMGHFVGVLRLEKISGGKNVIYFEKRL